MERAVIHLNIADFAVAVETCITPALKGYPIVIAPTGAPRAMVYDMSEEAFQQGIRKGMPLSRACRLNRDLRILPPSFNRYEKAMKDLLRQGLDYTPLIESGSTDGHLFMDVTKSTRLFGPPVDMAFRLKKNFKKNYGLDPIWSVATNKVVAKVATRIVKPAGEYIVAPGDEEAFLDPLPVHLVPGIDKTQLEQLYAFNLFYIFQVKKLTLLQLELPFSREASMIYRRIRGIDTAAVRSPDQADNVIRADHEYADDTNDAFQLKKGIRLMTETVCFQLRAQKRHAASARIILSYSDGIRAEAQAKIRPATAGDRLLFKKILAMFNKTWKRRVRIRHLQLDCGTTPQRAVQDRLFTTDTESHRQSTLTRAIDGIRKRFGSRAVCTALTLAGDNSLP